MAFAHDRDRRLGRSKQDNLVVLRLAAERRDAPVFALGEVMSCASQHAGMGFRRAAILGRDDDRREAAERGKAAEPSLLGLFAVEPLGVAGHERRNDGVFRLPGLQEGVARLVAAPGASGRLAQELERALGRARIGVGEADVRVNDADKGQNEGSCALWRRAACR